MQGPFYTSTTTLCDGEVELTDDILNLPGTIEENMSHYYLGYISDEQMPTLWHMGTLTLENGVMRGSIIRQNYGWGYIWHWGDSDGTNVALMRGALIYENNGVKSNKVSTYSQHFVNKCAIANANSQNYFRIFFGLMPVKESELTPDGTSMRGYSAGHYNQFMTKDVSLTAEQIEQFINGTHTVTLTGIQMGGGSYSVSFTGTDFDEETRLCKITGISTYDQEIILYICVEYMTTYGMQAFLADDSQKYTSRLAPFFAADIVGDGGNIPDQTVLLAPNNMSNKTYILAQANFDATGTTIDSVQFLVGTPAYNGNLGATAMGDYSWADGLTIADFYQHRMVNGTDTVVEKWWYATSGIVRDKYIVAGGTNSMMAQVVCPLPLSDLIKITALSLNKIETAITSANSPNSFTCSQTYTTAYSVAMYDVETTDSLGERKSENYADIAAELLNWQKPGNDITVDEFKADDIPEWLPPGPEPSDWGDDRYGTVPGLWLSSDGITANFITPWVLKGSQVSNFGRFLWENLFLPDPDDPSVINGLWKNFLDAMGTYWQTGSFDPASTLDFVVSLLYFPFDLTSNSADTSSKQLYFGTGVLGLTVSSSYNTRKLSTYHGWIYGGGLNLADAEVKKSLGIPDDFRGLANTSACIYLPFCGTYQVNWADIKDSDLTIFYAIDFTTGACTAYVISSKSGSETYVLNASGIIGFSVPLSATNANRLAASILGDLSASGSKFFDTGHNAAAKIITGSNAETPSQMAGNGSDDGGDLMSMQMAGGPIVGSAMSGITAGGRMAKEIFSKPSIGIPSMSGGSGWNALHCPRTPYLQVRTPQYIPDRGHGHHFGWPDGPKANMLYTVESLPKPDASNYYECVNVDTSSLSCTHEERQMIKRYLENGFYIRK